jgi:diguanylate cyclase (GGDEF)-like protein
MADNSEPATVEAVRELGELKEQIRQAGARLAWLQVQIADAENRLDSSQAVQLLEANEQLVLAMLQAQADVETGTQALEAMSRTAELDALTELPNRMLLLDRFARAIAGAKRRRSGLALMFLDLDHFKQINDTLGHAVGDAVLREVALRLTATVRDADTVSRHGGDEFVILLNEVSQPSDARLIAGKLLAAICAPCHVGDLVLRLSASIGISLYPDDGDEVDLLIERADAAMYVSKGRGSGGFFLYGDESTGHVRPAREAHVPLALRPGQEPAAVHQRWHEELREANAQLVLAALSAQELQTAAEHAHRKQTEFLAVVAHELRNPLAPIRTAASLLNRMRPQDLPAAQAIIERQVAHMSRVVDDLLDVSRVNTGKLHIERRMVDMAAIIQASLDACRPAMEARKQRLALQLPDGTPLPVRGDAIRLSQVLTNLLDNASKYTPDGGDIWLSATAVDDALVITVTDTGIGIAPLSLPTVFEPFVQDPHAIGFNGGGLGLGLTVVAELVAAHGGQVVASSDGTGCGSRFVVTLPLASQAVADAA